ncbi:hypothetical protein [Marinobacter salarius]|uniref:Uncharacterized protein n=1 Tax=Marinobacter salarius TaxID=1420917 RepID=A0A1W6KFX8_9GAMM|nr:hypothetical protein [Marinobacter salarius]ARM86324.1 hypothetical protein MARSALSMR5_04307 [Marinobacter salarius]
MLNNAIRYDLDESHGPAAYEQLTLDQQLYDAPGIQPVVPKINDLQDLLVPNEVALFDKVRNHLDTLSKTNRESYESTRRQFVKGLTDEHLQIFEEFWTARFHQYSNTDRFLGRIADSFSMTTEMARTIAEVLGLPKCPEKTSGPQEIGSFQSVIFIDGTENLIDPLSRYYSKSVYRASNAEAWDEYLFDYGWLMPDALDPADVRYVLREYPMPTHRKAMLLQVRDSELDAFASSMEWPNQYQLCAAPVRDLLAHKRHDRLTRIIVKSAQALYTHQAIPLQVIAERIGVTASMLYTLGENFGEGWKIPSASTIHHVIDHVNVIHMANGGVIRRTAGL